MSENSSNSSTEKSGNTKQISPSKHWCFTFNNYTQDDIKEFIEVSSISSNKYIFQEETGEEGTPHLQGYIEFIEKIRPKNLYNNTIHWEKCRNIKKSILYCSKEDTRTGEIFSHNIRIPRPLALIPKDILRPNQQEIVDLFKEDCPPIWEKRGLIHWFWEHKGGWGKSVVTLYMVDHMNAFVVSGANKDILHGFRTATEEAGEAPPIVVFDIPRCNEGHISYQAIESIKTGVFFSAKYESNKCRFNPPHVVCFSNEPPDVTKMSMDRWRIKELEKNKQASSYLSE